VSATEYLAQLVELCNKEPNNVQIGWDAKHDADRDFKLGSENEIKAFVGNKGLERPVHEKSTQLKIWKDGSQPIAHSYAFFSEGKKGYISFYHVPKTEKIFIKSFKYHYDQHMIDIANRKRFGIASDNENTKEK
jgi:hypothetical protein